MNNFTINNLFVMLRENLLLFALLFGSFSLTAQISISFDASEPTCNGYTDGSVFTTVDGGVAPYIYTWSNGYSGSSLLGVGAGTYSVTVTDAAGETADGTYELQQPGALSMAISLDDVCAGDGNATANTSGGVAPFTYLWDDGQTGSSATGLSAGSHCATVTDANGCQAVGCEIVYAQLSVEVFTTGLLCATDCDASLSAVIMGGFGPYSFIWSNGATTQIVANQPAGTYSVTVTDANGCVAVGTNTIDAPPLLEVNASITNPPCGVAGATGSATANPTGGVPPYKYFWSTGQNTQTIDNLPPGNYYVVVTDDNGCQAVDNFAVIEDGGFDLSVDSTPASECGVYDGTASSSVSGGTAPYTFEWSTGSSTQNINSLSPGIYTVTVTDADGCQAVADVTVGGTPEVEIMLFEEDVTCGVGNDGVGTAVAFSGTPPFFYSWSNGATTSVNPDLTPGTYTVTVTDANDCTATGTVNIGGGQDLDVSASGNNLTCAGDNTGSASVSVFGGTAPFNIDWSNGQSSSTISNLASGTYSVTVTDVNSCSGVGSVTISEPAAISIDVTPTSTGCSGTSNGGATASASGGTPPFSYAWSNGQSGSSITNVSAGTYTVTATDSEGCTATASVNVSSGGSPSCNAFIISNISAIGASDGSAGVDASGGTAPYFYNWSNGQVTSTATGLSAGTYTVTVTDANDCTTTCSVTLTAPTKLGDFAWLDSNRDGCQDADEPGIHDVVIQLSGTDNDGNLVVRYDTSDFQGAYLFDDLAPGNYKISVEIPTGYILTGQNACGDATDSDINPSNNMSQNVNLSAGDCYFDLDIGIYLECENVTSAGEIEGDETLCGPGNDAGPITEVTPPSGGFGNIEYLWMKSTQGGPFNPNTWQVIPGATGPEYDPGVIYETTYYTRCVRREFCTTYLETNIVVKTVGSAANAVIEGPDVACVGETTTYSTASSGPGATYFWDFGPNATPSTSTQQIVDVVFNSVGVVTIQLEVNANGCQASNNLPISVTDNPAWCGNALVIHGTTNEKGQVELQWEMGSMPGVWTFDVLRSKDGDAFQNIGQISPSAESGMETFKFMDENPFRGTGFYKVTIQDENGDYYAESNMISAGVFKPKSQFFVYPNPFNNELKIDLNQTDSENIEIQIFSPVGKHIQTEIISSNAVQHQLSLSNLSAGIYYLRMIVDGEKQEVIKVLKE